MHIHVCAGVYVCWYARVWAYACIWCTLCIIFISMFSLFDILSYIVFIFFVIKLLVFKEYILVLAVVMTTHSKKSIICVFIY